MKPVEMDSILLQPAIIQPWIAEEFSAGGLNVDVLRLDLIHSVISGNKWYKLKYHLEQALIGKYKMLLTWGGAYSNHLVATAFAAQSIGLPSVGMVRGEAPERWSQHFADCRRIWNAIAIYEPGSLCRKR